MKGWSAQRKLWAQALCFLLIMVPPAGLYLTIGKGQDFLTWGLLAAIAAGMLLGMIVW